MLYLTLALALSPAAVATLKTVGGQHCPHELIEFGGYAPDRGLLEREAPDVQAGRCFISGHASAGFALCAFYFAGLALARRRLARLGLWGGLSAGLVFGFTRVAQGSHFLSDVLWAGLVCWVVSLALYALLFGFRSAAPRRPAAGSSDPESAAQDSPRGIRPPAMARARLHYLTRKEQ
jgi:membrane-associated PAP2 superfamily phosphatase